jgi:hypothetical protein
MFKLGRIILWIVFFPAGIWRSLKHGQRKRDDRMIKALGGTIPPTTHNVVPRSSLAGAIIRRRNT